MSVLQLGDQKKTLNHLLCISADPVASNWSYGTMTNPNPSWRNAPGNQLRKSKREIQRLTNLYLGCNLGLEFLPSLKVQIFSQKTRIQVRFLMTNVEPPDIFFGGGRGGRRTSHDRVDLQKVPPKNPKNLDSGSGFFSRIQTIRLDRSGVFFFEWVNGWTRKQYQYALYLYGFTSFHVQSSIVDFEEDKTNCKEQHRHLLHVSNVQNPYGVPLYWLPITDWFIGIRNPDNGLP